ncbi:MAG: hypothetical protein HYX73_05175 [Acidobacteria bacterium]|nr:hypothetical protein [Acidobacteriota bacterium]
MPRYLTSHNMACMTRQGAKELAERLRAAKEVEFLRLVANMTEGQLISEFEAASREVIEGWLKQSGIHYEWLRRIDFEATREAFHDL